MPEKEQDQDEIERNAIEPGLHGLNHNTSNLAEQARDVVPRPQEDDVASASVR